MTLNEKARQGDDLASPTYITYARNTNPSAREQAYAVLFDAVVSARVSNFTALAIIAAAESFAKACTREEFAAFLAELNRGVEGAA